MLIMLLLTKNKKGRIKVQRSHNAPCKAVDYY